ncbi:catalase-like [Uloborus diversus]|uniref:catalase-like n=1 Tax=Uloborus diversus TaxID=327109 RepID=UPI002409CFC8|nr:catalase-like [Uloborus diversus]
MALDAKIRANGRWSNPESDPKLQSLVVSRDTILRSLMEACSKEDMCLFDVASHPADDQQGRKKTNSSQAGKTLKSASGRPIGNKLSSLTAGQRGPLLLQDFTYIEEISHFDRERIPDRVVHAKGNGAFGYFEVTDDVTQYTKAKLFCEVGKRTPIAVRFSLAGADVGAADTTRDIRGFAIKFYTEEGNWDLVGIHLPVFPIRDPINFPSFVHTQKRNPVTNLRPDLNMFWDFFALRPESTHLVLYLFSDEGIPESYRNIDGFGVNTFKLVNESGDVFYCKFSYFTDQGKKFIFPDIATQLAGSDPDYYGRDLYNAIENGKYPSWTFYIQVMTPEETKSCSFNPFDPTKIWPENEYPLIKVGKLVLNKTTSNHFAEVEQIAFCPANLVPGIEVSPDKVLQGRIFSYLDTQRYRLGTNFFQLPVNCPFRSRPRNYERDGTATVTDNQDGAPNYFPNSFGGPVEDPKAEESTFVVHGEAARYDTSNDDNFTQAGVFYRKRLNEGEKSRLVKNIVQSLSNAEQFIQERQIENFSQADPELGERVRIGLEREEEP